MSDGPTALTCAALDAERWPDLERLIGTRGGCGGCWCMWWRLPRSVFERGKGEDNREALRALVEAGEPVGVLGYHAGEPVAWCAVAPRTDYPGLGRSRVLRAVDEEPVWSVTAGCLRLDRTGVGIRRGRLRGGGAALADAADHAVRRGALPRNRR
jgi:hypothetical protein